jgi:hypothetical protein
MASANFKSKRISRTSTITLNAPLDESFPLFGPVREQEWAAEWQPEILYSTTNLVEERMVFKTPTHHGHEEATWVVSKYRPEQSFIEYTVFASERVWWLTIQCREDIPHQTTKAEITYTYTGLTEKGNAVIEKELQMMYARDLKNWEEAINHYLKTREKRSLH